MSLQCLCSDSKSWTKIGILQIGIREKITRRNNKGCKKSLRQEESDALLPAWPLPNPVDLSAPWPASPAGSCRRRRPSSWPARTA
uniref:Uncharacterized protein n=1 Tax=Arundo donax TaxID=35708 RepID=A0A0A9GNB2_ARUDO